MINSPDEFLRILESDDAGSLRWAEATSETWIDLVSAFPDDIVRVVILCKRVTPAALAVAARSPSEFIRFLVAKKRCLSVETQASLARDPSPYVREHLARNKSVAPPLLLGMLEDDEATVRAVVRSRLAALGHDFDASE